MLSSNQTLIVPCTGRGENITHARLIAYAGGIDITYGKKGKHGFSRKQFYAITNEWLPYDKYPELYRLRVGIMWDLAEVNQLFDLADDEEVVAS